MGPTFDRAARGFLLLAIALAALLAYLVWTRAPDWSYQSDVTAPLTRNLLYIHPPSAWASFAAYLLVFGASLAYLNERDLRYDTWAMAAAEGGFVLNTVALVTGTFWGVQEWQSSSTNALVTVYTEPKVLVVVVLWALFAAVLTLRRLVSGRERAARLAAVFSLFGFLAVPASFLTSRLLSTSLHPDIAGPGKNPDAAVGGTVGWLMLLGTLMFLALFAAGIARRVALARLEQSLDEREAV